MSDEEKNLEDTMSEDGNADDTGQEGEKKSPEEPTEVLAAIAKLTEQLTALDSKIEAVKVSNADLIKKGLVIKDGKGDTTPKPEEDYKTLDQLDYSM
jgi:hypothetical protein